MSDWRLTDEELMSLPEVDDVLDILSPVELKRLGAEAQARRLVAYMDSTVGWFLRSIPDTETVLRALEVIADLRKEVGLDAES